MERNTVFEILKQGCGTSWFKAELHGNMYRSSKSIVNNVNINVTMDSNDNGVLECFLCVSDYLSASWGLIYLILIM